MSMIKPAPFLFLDMNTTSDFFDATGVMKVADAALIRKRLRPFVEAITEAKLFTLAVTDSHVKDDPEFAANALPPHGVYGTPGHRKIVETENKAAPVIPVSGQRRPWPNIPEFRQRGGQMLLEKNTFDAFANPAMRELLRSFQPKEVVMYGAVFEQDLKVTAIAARVLAFSVTIIEDLSGHRNPEQRLAAKGEMEKRGVHFEPLEEFMLRFTEWQKKAERVHAAATPSKKK